MIRKSSRQTDFMVTGKSIACSVLKAGVTAGISAAFIWKNKLIAAIVHRVFPDLALEDPLYTIGLVGAGFAALYAYETVRLIKLRRAARRLASFGDRVYLPPSKPEGPQ